MAVHTFNACIIHFRWSSLVHRFAFASYEVFFAYLGMAGGTIWQTEDVPGGERSVKEKGIFNMSNLFKCVFIDYHLFFINNYQSMSSIKILRHLLFLLIFSIILTADFTLILVTHKFVCCLPHLLIWFDSYHGY